MAKMNYSGNSICNYIFDNKLTYFCSAKGKWMLVCGNSSCIPKIIVFLSETNVINPSRIDVEKMEIAEASLIANFFKLPFLVIRFFSDNNTIVQIWDEKMEEWRDISYSQLEKKFQDYGLVISGTPRKQVNQYTSSSYHVWQRNTLGENVFSDIDLIKIDDNQVQKIVELKRSKIPVNKWSPYEKDFPNFALLINAIIHSGRKISFELYYYLLKESRNRDRVEDTSQIKVYDFAIPNKMITSNQVHLQFRNYTDLEHLLR